MNKSEIAEKYAMDISMGALNNAYKNSSGKEKDKLNEQRKKMLLSTSVSVRKDKENERHLRAKPGKEKQQLIDEYKKVRRNTEIIQEKVRRMLHSVQNRNLLNFLVHVDKALDESTVVFERMEKFIKNS